MLGQHGRDAVGEVTRQAMSKVLSHRLSGTTKVDTLYHYTGGAGATGIISSNQLRATHIGFLNDSSEYVLASRMAIEALEAIRDTSNASGVDEMVSAALENLTGVEDLARRPPLFVACFSEVGNDLSQWRAYGGGENGFALGFDTKRIFEYPQRGSMPLYLLPCVYEPAFQRILVTETMVDAAARYRRAVTADRPSDKAKYAAEFANSLLYEELSLIASIFKSVAFHAEKEWRLVYWERDTSRITVTSKSSMLSGYVVLPFDFGGPLPIVRAIVGPGRYTANSKLALQLLLEQKKHRVSVETSDVPYRVVT